ncbi:Replication factor-A carboxy-terminal domain protein [Arachis hypogaea]|nr:Replication factor-A carboxy-terminal domain protein [Arachis hypogaea]
MSYFSVVPNQGNYRTAEHEFKLVFLNRTTVISIPDDAIPKTCFSFCPFDELLKIIEDYVYLVGRLTIRYAMFGEYVDELHRFFDSAGCFVGQVGLQNVMHAIRLFFNPDLAEVVDFKNSMVDQGINGIQPLFIANEGKGVSLENDFMRLIRRCTIEELHDNMSPDHLLARYCSLWHTKPHGFTFDDRDDSRNSHTHSSKCVMLGRGNSSMVRYRIKIAVEDDNGHSVFVLFDREVGYLLKKSCADLFGKVQKDASCLWRYLSCDVPAIVGEKLLLKIDTKSIGIDKYFRTFRVRKVCDDAAIISMFKLPNYDTDDERTPLKDGYLGNIPSSDHEYIVGKKDPCEVLDEGITSDGNCSNMKANCKPLIDFLGEKGVEVSGLDDISSEADIVKEKGKIVNDSVIADRECSLKIEVLLNSPLVETTKETVYNPPRGGKVKRNLKKAFDDVADEELGPTSKILKDRDL